MGVTMWNKQILFLGMILVALSGCTPKTNQTVSNENITSLTQTPPLEMSKVDVNVYPLAATVCDPFGGEPSDDFTKGIRASLFYRLSTQPRMYSALDMTTFAFKSQQKLFFSDLNVPTRMFTEGFLNQTNDVLKNDQNQKLIEYFGMKFESALRLSDQDEEGTYQFATLSDDGVVMKTYENGTWANLISNDGDHPTKLGCSSRNISMTKNTVLPFEYHYYQGPRYHISNMLLWRKVTASTPVENKCGVEGNEYWFNPNNLSMPQPAFNQLLSRGWKIVGKDNFWITNPNNSQGDVGILKEYNPCIGGEKPTISDLTILEVFFDGAIVSWSTDIVATSQLLIINKSTGQRIETPSDNFLRTQHQITIQGLQAGTEYTVQAVSISRTLGATISDPITLTTL